MNRPQTGSPANEPPPPADATARAAREELAALAREPALGGSALAAASRRAVRHFAGEDAGEAPGAADGIEIWGRRIGRLLSLAAFAGLAVYLFLTYQ